MTGGEDAGAGRSGPSIGSGASASGSAPTYQGSRFPWWLALIWLAFFVWGFAYLAVYYLPDLKGWLLK